MIERPGEVVFHLGPPRDRPIFEGLPVRFGGIAEAAYVVCSGFDDDDVETVADYDERLAAMRARDLLMVCANPDLVVERGDRLVPCAGALALAYEEIGGPKARGDRLDDVDAGLDRSQLAEPHTIGESILDDGRDLESQACLADAAGPDERHDPGSIEQLRHGVNVIASAMKIGQRDTDRKAPRPGRARRLPAPRDPFGSRVGSISLELAPPAAHLRGQ